jgi:diadenosine tetraphosphatase ApaH/serine/threonine PP2A family protein phosphatase
LFDVIGDVHGCLGELEELLEKLVPRRTLVFVGDLCDRGPDTPGVLRLVMKLVRRGEALCVVGNHDDKLARSLSGNRVKVAHGLETSLRQLEEEPESFRRGVVRFLEGLPDHLLLDEGRLLVAHAGMKPRLLAAPENRRRPFALYGETTGEIDAWGLPVRADWASRYRGEALCVYGHTPCVEPRWVGQTVCIDTGCVFGGKLTALRYPERKAVSVPARKAYYSTRRPLVP